MAVVCAPEFQFEFHIIADHFVELLSLEGDVFVLLAISLNLDVRLRAPILKSL